MCGLIQRLFPLRMRCADDSAASATLSALEAMLSKHEGVLEALQ